jgi:hypothetical protein
MKKKLIPFLLFASLVSTAQRETLCNQLKLSPFTFLKSIRGTEISYERKYLNNYLSTQVSLQYIFDPFAGTNFSTWHKMQGFSAAIEQKYFFYKEDEYVSIDFKWLNCRFEDYAGFVFKYPKDSLEYFSSYNQIYTVTKTTKTFGLRFGTQEKYGRFIMDMNVGIGIRYREVTHSDRINPADKMNQPRHPNIEYSQTVNGNYFIFNIPIGFKIGYLF